MESYKRELKKIRKSDRILCTTHWQCCKSQWLLNRNPEHNITISLLFPGGCAAVNIKFFLGGGGGWGVGEISLEAMNLSYDIKIN
jgi:hypothetical protein